MADTARAETFRVATFAAPLSGDGPGLLLRDIQSGETAQIIAIQNVISRNAPDILVLTDFDYDLDGIALAAFAASFADPFPHVFALPSNAGLATGLDLNANGRLGEARDAHGYGRFAGDGGMAILSRFPILAGQVTDFSGLLWKDLPDATLPQLAGAPFLDSAAIDQLRLSSTGHWIVPVAVPDGPPISVMAFDATPPVFDGPEDMNGLRNRDELRLWEIVLDGGFGPAPDSFVVAGNANLDPRGGDGYRQAMTDFLALASLQDPLPDLPTAEWPDDGPGKLRVSYVLPSRDWQIAGAGVFWPDPDDPDRALLGEDGLAAGPHRLVWVDISR
ncbi:endonuclease [Loktanella sp. 5RATIMAR09]|uniref:endonuclease/exonuclease/phosphatase family protein n=1 Tax=Loktanella sp. 5RATIMAR09 TaxID=1225655 RepID=UPI0006EBB995|nr:endonuclease/exonuclease/phosphatase family protein [Loktanella sp. 5RATIMAR09]KQI72433.1 endonuclease [Loktanella sp. 5RATIMAR09]